LSVRNFPAWLQITGAFFHFPRNVSHTLLNLMEIIMNDNSAVTLPGTVEEIVVSSYGPEKVKIKVGDQGLQIKNMLTDAEGKETRLNPGDDVQITIKAPPESTTTKPNV
jgi:hypothetical protein